MGGWGDYWHLWEMEEMNSCTLLVDPLFVQLSITLPSLISLSPLQPEIAVPPCILVPDIPPSPFGKPFPQTTFNEMHIHCILIILTSCTDQSMETCTYYQVIRPRNITLTPCLSYNHVRTCSSPSSLFHSFSPQPSVLHPTKNHCCRHS